MPDPSVLWPIRPLVLFTATHVFHTQAPLSYGFNSGSGDDTFGWVLAFCLLVIAALATAIWPLLDSRRVNHVNLQKWFRVFLRFSLAGQMFSYGMDKVVPNQMPFPSLAGLLRPYGSLTPMRVLWFSIGASPAYEIFAGCAEVLGGLLLIFPRTATLGALICLADMIQVFALNMTYDVPVKLFAFHLILLSLFLVAPDLPRLTNVLFRNRATQPSSEMPLFGSRRAVRIALAAQILLGFYILGDNAYAARKVWYAYGGGAPKSQLYGIWEVTQMSLDGQLHPPLLTDTARFRRVIFDSSARVDFQSMDDSFTGYAASIDRDVKVLALTKGADKNWKATLTINRPAPEQLVLDGAMGSHRIQLQLHLADRREQHLLRGAFHWIQN